jgi:hyaluronan synthase
MPAASPARSLAELPASRRAARLRTATGFIFVVQIVSLAWTLAAHGRYAPVLDRHFAGLVLFEVLALAATAHMLFRAWLVAGYRPAPEVEDARLPSVTVVVPAYNEGRQVLSTLRSLAASDYPAGRLQLIAVDDGSDDDTWQWMCRAKQELGERVTTVRCERNGGKRKALHQGFLRASGEVIVTVDSDSEVLPETLRRLVAPFLADPECGAVAGNVRVLNRHQGALPKMLDAAFTAAFDFTRAGESEVGGVMCCPGALSAYRADLIRPVLEQWLEQRFLGIPAKIGEDRALTNLILRAGATTHYQSDAIVLTQVPTRTKGLCKMFLRWARSNVRESFVLGTFIWGSRTKGGRSRLALTALFSWAVVRMLVSAAVFLPQLALVARFPWLLGLLAGYAMLTASQTFAITLATRDRSVAIWAFAWGVYALLVTSWITPWALVTARRSGWLTRGPAKQGAIAPVLVLSTAREPGGVSSTSASEPLRRSVG